MSTGLKTNLQNFSNNNVHPAPGIHDHHVNVSKAVDLREAVDNNLLVSDASAEVRLIASYENIIKASLETVQAHCLKHLAASEDFRQVQNQNISCEQDASDTEVIEALKTFRPSSAGGVDGLRPGHLKDLTASSTAKAGVVQLKHWLPYALT